MPEVDSAQLTVRFDRLEREAKTIESYSIASDFMTPTDGFEFTYYSEDRNDMLGLELEPVQLMIGGNSQVIGRIDQTEFGNKGSAVTCRGRDHLGDATECNIDPTFAVTKGELLFSAIARALIPVGIPTVLGSDDIRMRDVRTGVNVSGNKPEKNFKELKQEDVKPQPGESVFEFINRLCSRHGATIQPGPTRDSVIVTEPMYDQEPIGTITRTDDPTTSVANNVIRGVATRDWSSVPTYALWHGKGGSAGKQRENNTITLDVLELVQGISVELTDIMSDTVWRGRRKPKDAEAMLTGQLYRLLYDRDDESRNRDQLLRAATRGMGIRLKDTLQYNVTLQGHADNTTGAFWAVDTIVNVNDDICDLHEPLWVASRTFKYDGSPTTDLTLWRPGTFII